MASCSKRSRVAESDSEDSDSPIELLEETTGGLESGEESELDHLLANESDISSDEDFSLHLSASELEEEDDERVSDLPAPLPDVPPPEQEAPTAASHPTDAATFYGATAARPCPGVPPGPHAPPVVPVLGRGRACGGRAQARGGHPGRGRAHGRGQVREAAVPVLHETYDDRDQGNPPLVFKPTRPIGVHFGQRLLRNAMTTAVEFFELFFSVELVKSIVTHTNSYAYEHVITHQSYAKGDGSWQEVTEDEIRRLIAILIYFGLVRVSDTVDNYWSARTPYHGLWGKCFMTRIRFKALMAMLHVVDPANEPDGDKLHKINSLLEFFKARCKDLYQPRQNVAIDERIVKSRHRSGIRQFNKDKPTRWGIKLWVLADSSNGYTIDFNVYIGKVAGQDVSANGLGYDVVMKLMNPYFHQGYHLYVDNFYTSVTLFKDLFAMGVGATGTIRENRRDFPPNLKDSKVWAKGKDRGSIRWGRDPPCLALQWLDNKVVSMLTTIDNANVKKQATRKIKTARGEWTGKAVPQPGVISNYNKFMNAVDRSDQILGTNNVHRKCVRWWKTLFFHLIDIAIVNSYILFKEHCTNLNTYPVSVKKGELVWCAGRKKKNSTKSKLTVKRHSVTGICIYRVTKIVSRYIIHSITLINVETL